MTKLTAKQQAFCNNIALEGMNQSEAYRDAYATSKMSDNVVWNESSKLMDNREVTVRINELKASLQEKVIEGFVKSKIELLEELEAIKKDSLNDKERKIAIDCIKEQGKLLGYYVDTSKLIGDKDNPLETKETKILIEFIKPKE